ncbi:hypothetical protein VaNZ11_014015 [Volvox africanus]|uniref:Uncharacterized protein n=1 Tax=Volvox africanus TaxID=51714 RepID=A0ABQ5SIP2_9CHLO|nr:hypothetical protein VaNZ11_014015 [Volvox africanus]
MLPTLLALLAAATITQLRQQAAAVNTPGAVSAFKLPSLTVDNMSPPRPGAVISLLRSRCLTTTNNNNSARDWMPVPIILVIVIIATCACNVCFRMRSRRKPQDDQVLTVAAAAATEKNAAAAVGAVGPAATAAMPVAHQEPPQYTQQPQTPAMTEPESASATTLPRPLPMHPPAVVGHSPCADTAGPHRVRIGLTAATSTVAAASTLPTKPGKAQDIAQLQEWQLQWQQHFYLHLQYLQHHHQAVQQQQQQQLAVSLQHPPAVLRVDMEIPRAAQQQLSPSRSAGPRLMTATHSIA